MGANTLSVLVVLILCYGTALPLAGGVFGGLTSAVGRDSTFTGRTDIWAKLVPVFEQGPLLGCGFGGFWTPETRAIHIIGQAHNGYLQILIELGLIGLTLVSLFLLSCVRKAARALAYDFYWASLFICFVLIAAVHNSTEASINSFTNFLTAVVLFVWISIAAGSGRRARHSEYHGTRSEEAARINSRSMSGNPLTAANP
jgi:O-antigen ligase